jgi:hypothetical protein
VESGGNIELETDSQNKRAVRVRRVPQNVCRAIKLLQALAHPHGHHDLPHLQHGFGMQAGVRGAHGQTHGQHSLRQVRSRIRLHPKTKSSQADNEMWKKEYETILAISSSYMIEKSFVFGHTFKFKLAKDIIIVLWC